MTRRLVRLNAFVLSLALIGALLTTSGATPTQASPFQKKGAWDLGLTIGGMLYLDQDAVPHSDGEATFPTRLEHTFTYYLSGTYNFSRHFAVELAQEFSPAEVNRNTFMNTHLDLVWHPIVHKWFVPFAGVGASLSVGIPQNFDWNDVRPGFNAMLGLKMYPWRNVGFRFDMRYLGRIASSPAVFGHDLSVNFGFAFTFGGEEEITVAVLLDTDGDGILDDADACPKVPGVASANGCPDKDGDSITDNKDACPDKAGPRKYDGCPDSDGDTVVDGSDRCPQVPGSPELKGCPDGDADKIADMDDRCPKIPGTATFQGCPPPPPIEVITRFEGVMVGITFEQGKDVIRDSSYAILNDAVSTLKQYKQLRIAIDGHTSSEGVYDENVELSRRRAASVKAYMTAQGIDASRMETNGYGPDQPIASNDTRKGRKKNRRIEFRLLRK